MTASGGVYYMSTTFDQLVIEENIAYDAFIEPNKEIVPFLEFKYDNLTIEKKGDAEFELTYDITNTSDKDGAEVSQVYIHEMFSMVTRPEKELKAFDKSYIKAGETKRIKITLGFDSFAFYSTAYDRWHVENGPYEFFVGASSRDIRLKTEVDITLPDDTQNSR